MTNEVYKISVNLGIHKLNRSNNIYCLDNIENIIQQLFVETHYQASIRNEAGRLCTSGASGGEMLFFLDSAVPTTNNNFQSLSVCGVVNLDEVVKNQLTIQGKLEEASLTVYYEGQENPEITALPDVAVSFKKVCQRNLKKLFYRQ
jgi:hypothetical protein